MAPGTVGHSPTGDIRGPDEWARSWDRLTGAFPDIAVHLDDTVSDGRNVVVRWRVQMTHTGPHLGFPPSGNAARAHGLTWLVVEGGKIVEGWDGWDATGMLATIGGASLHPALAKAGGAE
jgi:predicted ester cyclase